ncbi:unnamed protein product [Danaus chrysippus]|uniref:(African queen) hypothetical protein n=1 Tax=Danaus chrysippus TaxID=151541 RepID=A0A8J2RA04_9NEOP|nr:unnamed protein product [Danaus chrysippus]
MSREVSGKIIVITGAATGLGHGMADNFLQKGAKTVIVLDINEKKGQEAVSSFNKKYGNNRAVFIKCNVCTDLEEVFDKIVKDYSDVDCLINNAGIFDENNLEGTIGVNVTALIKWSMKFYDYMRIDRGGKGGTIINVSSIYGYRIMPYIPFYHASKYAVIGFSKSLGHEMNFKRSGVCIATLCPGLTFSSMTSEPRVKEKDMEEEFLTHLQKDYEWQYPEAIGKGTVEIYEKAESGSVWLVEGSRPAEKINV